MSGLESRIGELVGAFEKELFERAGSVQTKLDGAIENAQVSANELAARMNYKLNAYEQGAENVSRMLDHVLRTAMEEMHEKATAATKPLLAELESELMKDLKVRADAIGKSAAAKFEEMKKQLDQHVEDLCASGEQLFEQAEERIGQRIRDVRPAAARALESAADMLNQRLAQMLSSARGMVELTESQLQRRIEGLGGQAAAAMRAMEAELAEKLAQVSHQAHHATTQLEEELNARAAEMLERERRIMGADASRPQLEVFVKGPRPTPSSDSAAA